jgi:predicted DNA-binding transcriptional regulator YafY
MPRVPRAEIRSERAFDPYGIAYHEGFWYTIGYCHLREDQRLFRLDRITQIEMTSATFPPRVHFPALQAVQQALASVPRRWQVEVWLETTLEEAQRQTRLPKAFIEEGKGGVLLRVEVEDLPWMARLLASLDIPFIVHCPLELRDVLRQHARTLVSYSERMEA